MNSGGDESSEDEEEVETVAQYRWQRQHDDVPDDSESEMTRIPPTVDGGFSE